MWTRAVGAALVLPLALALVQEMRQQGRFTINRRLVAGAAAALLPVAAYLLWDAALGAQFHAVEDNFFARGMLLVDRSVKAWMEAFSSIGGTNPQASTYYLLELASVALALVACLLMLPRYPGESLFGLAVLLLSFTSGVPQSMIRYVLAVPSIYIFLAWLGRSPVFDRAWTTASVLLLGLLTTLFTFDMWVA